MRKDLQLPPVEPCRHRVLKGPGSRPGRVRVVLGFKVAAVFAAVTPGRLGPANWPVKTDTGGRAA